MKKIAIVFAAGLVVGCATTATYQAVGGSRADGVVRLAFEYGMFENPRVDENAALTTARERCRVWGYTDAEAFGAATTQCAAYNGYGCARTMVTKEYQCTGAHAPS